MLNFVRAIRRNLDNGDPNTLLAVFVAGVTLLTVFASATMSYVTLETVRVEIVDAGNITVSSGKNVTNEWVVYTDNEVFSNNHSIWQFKWNSHRIQSQFIPGAVCDLKVNGLGIGRRNIVEVINCYPLTSATTFPTL